MKLKLTILGPIVLGLLLASCGQPGQGAQLSPSAPTATATAAPTVTPMGGIDSKWFDRANDLSAKIDQAREGGVLAETADAFQQGVYQLRDELTRSTLQPLDKISYIAKLKELQKKLDAALAPTPTATRTPVPTTTPTAAPAARNGAVAPTAAAPNQQIFIILDGDRQSITAKQLAELMSQITILDCTKQTCNCPPGQYCLMHDP